MNENTIHDTGVDEPSWSNVNIRYLQMRIDSVIAELNDDNDRVNEHYIVNSDQFQNEIKKVRKRLNVNPIKDFNVIFDLESWAEHNIKLDVKNKNISKSIYFIQIINEAIENIKLPKTWRDTFAHYVVTDSKPKYTFISPKLRLARVKQVDSDSITIQFSKGIRNEEYTKIWSGIKDYLGQGRRKNKTPDNEIRHRDMEMYTKRLSGMKYSDIGKEYFSTDQDISTETAKKAIQRQKILHEKGTDLAE